MPTHSPPLWLELLIDCVGDDVRIGARGSRGQNVSPQPLGIQRSVLDGFAKSVERAAAQGRRLPNEVVTLAQTIQKAVLANEIGTVFTSLRGAGEKALLLRFVVARELQTIPWEGLCNAGEALGFWGSAADVLPVRTVATTESWKPSEVRGAVKVLAIAPTESNSLANLNLALRDGIARGEIEWLDPIEGAAAGKRTLFDQLRRHNDAHVLHFLGHAGFDHGLPALRLADDDDEEQWLPIELLAQQLKASFSHTLRLVVLEACEGARPSDFASAAESLAKARADAVVAHLWPVRADVARTCSTNLYRALTSARDGAGDVAFAANEARRAILSAHDSSAQALSPVVYLRAPEGRLFDFARRNVGTAGVSAPAPKQPTPAAVVLPRIVGTPFSLVLGDHWNDTRQALSAFRSKLHHELSVEGHTVRPDNSIGALAHAFELHFSEERLVDEFRRIFPITMAPPTVLSLVARRLCPGVHTSLLRHPWLEACVAKEQPNRTIVVFQYDDQRLLILKRERGKRDWDKLAAAPTYVDANKDIVILRPYGGYTLSMPFTRPLLTESDYQRRLSQLWSPSILPVDLGYSLQRALRNPPAWMLGLSMMTAHHRTLLQNLFQHGLPRNSVAMVEKNVHERALWKQVGGKRAMQGDEDVVETTIEALHEALAALPPGREG